MNSPAFLIREEIQRAGPLSFARFMELALYAPGAGYYEQPREIGRRGDFFTSVSVGAVFGELLAFEFARRLEALAPAPARVQILEAGAHDGRLAQDILSWLRVWRPELFARLEYRLIEPSPIRRAWQEQTVGLSFTNLRWLADVRELGERSVTGIIFGNELLDAMPVHRMAWGAAERRWWEWRVAWARDAFVWEKGPASPEAARFLPVVLPNLAAVLPDGFTIEVSPAAIQWWTRAAASLQRGCLLTLDYGLQGEERLRPERPAGTLRAYLGHHVSDDVLARPGEQDMTAHVDFSALRPAGEEAGLRTEGLVSQESFLTEIFRGVQAAPSGFAPWTPVRLRQFQTLTHPDHLGQRFRVLMQSR